jgi:hypothetical protein
MISSLRSQYNDAFSKEKNDAFISHLESTFPGQLDFRVAESPLFIPADFTKKILDACESIIDVVGTADYYQASEKSIPSNQKVPGENKYPHFIAFDFGICSNDKGELEPQLIEMQGFPSLFCWQAILPEIHQQHYNWPPKFSPYLNGHTKTSYIQLLKDIIIADEDPSHVILLEILPPQQKTRVDFYATEALLGIRTVCITQLETEGENLFYFHEGKKIKVKRIFNRVIFDDLLQQTALVQEKGKIFLQELDVEWIPHPNWFFRLSKFSLPFIDHPYVPETKFLSELPSIPNDLENYVVKPLFSFAGQGVIIDVNQQELDKIKDPENWIIQKKVRYAAAIETPGEMAKAEIRIFYFWPPGAARPHATNNLCRLSKGKMVGVRYNKDKDWVGGSFCLFEQ